MTNPHTKSGGAGLRALRPLSLLPLLCCTRDVATQTLAPLERQVVTDAITRVRDDGGGANPVVDGFLRFHNTGTTAVRVALLPCPFQLAVYRSEARTGAPAWEERRPCTMRLISVTLRPGARDSVSSSVPFREILGDSLPDGRYYFALRTGYQVLRDPRPGGPTEGPRPYVFSGGDALLHR